MLVAYWAYLHGKIVRLSLSRSLANNQAAPGLVAFVDDFSGILLILGLTRESKSVLGFSIRDLVDPEPFIGGTDKTRKMPLNILNVIKLGG